ncbi:Uu.00g016820.m01.CDS01 [Anthostomella pinea]|uniref:Uu.00g016820.m01.CDS01 n=1 Tax=Anthostomella pinea TaxID=933095 RepID=A0AAI8YQH3_9PEZI|nr:Uu.00g016820.m01.CDS01 [Anthostomella pinea]
MDPDCAICQAPANLQCDCEAKGLEQAVRQAEDRMMASMYQQIRTWVRGHAQDYILEYFRLMTERRKASHAQHLERLTAHAYHYYHAPPHPNEIAVAQGALKRGIDEDWQASVQRYPEVLEYFFNLVDLTLPSDDDPAVKDPPLSALNGGSRKSGRRASTVAPESFHERERNVHLSRRTPPPNVGNPMAPPPGSRRHPGFRAPPPPPTMSYGYGGGY